MKTLMELMNEADNLMNMLIESNGEITPEIEDLLAMSGREMREKLDCYGAVIDAMKARQTYAIGRMTEWERVASQTERALESIRARIIFAMHRMELPEVHGYEYTFRLQANPPSVVIEDEAAIPGEFLTTETKITTKPNKREIIDAFKDGRFVPGARVERSERLVLKPSQRKEFVTSKTLEKV